MPKNRTLTEVLVARERLLARSAQQRGDLADACRALAGPVGVIDRILAGGRYLVRHPLALAGVVAAVVVLRGRSVLGLAARGLAVWRLARRFQGLLRALQR